MATTFVVLVGCVGHAMANRWLIELHYDRGLGLYNGRLQWRQGREGQVVEAYPTVWFPRNCEKMKINKKFSPN